MAKERVQRRLAAILAADVAGYSRLMGADEEGTHAALIAHRRELIDPKISEYGGRIANTAGDSVLAEFPSVVEALRCAIDVQRGIAERNSSIPKDRRIELRIGLNLGDVIEQDGDLLGEGINVAARLESLADPGGICLSRAARDQVRDLMEIALEDLGEIEVKNIVRPVRVFRYSPDGDITPSKRASAIAKSWRLPAIAAALVAVIAGAAVWNFYLRDAPFAPNVIATANQGLSIVVLPFDNLSDGKNQDYFADGITEDLITDLSRIRGMFVIARGTSFTYKGKAVDSKKVAKDLDVRYVLEGSVRRAGDQVRVNAQLIDGTNGAHLWSERFDRQFKDVFALQNEITGRLARALKLELIASESYRSRQGLPKNLEAWDYALQAYAKLLIDFKGSAEKHIIAGKQLAEKAVQLDPQLALGWIALSEAHYRGFLRGYATTSRTQSRQQFLDAARKAVQLDPKSADAYTQLGLALRVNKQVGQAIAACETSLTLNPNHDDALICLGLAKIARGDPADALPLFSKSRRLNPKYRAFRRDQFTGYAHLLLGQHPEAIDWIKKSITSRPNSRSRSRYPWLAAALAWQGKLDEAREALAFYAAVKNSAKSITIFRKRFGHFSPNMERVYEGLRKAGMPEHSPPKPPEKPSIAVLTFTNMSDDRQQAYFADGITEDITIDLSKVVGLLVTPSSATRRFKGKDIDRRVIAGELGVRHILEGGVRRVGNRLRITAKLIDAATGVQVWAERYDRDQKDVFAIQDDIADRVVAELSRRLKAGGLNRVARSYTPNLEAYDLYIQGRAKRIPPTPSNLATALRMFEKAIEIDPKFAGGYAGAAYVHLLKYGIPPLPGAEPSNDLEAALKLAEKAVTLDPTFGPAWGSLSEAYSRKRRYDDALQAIGKAMKAAPNDSLMRATYGRLLGHMGRPQEGIEQVKQAMRMSPDSLPMLYFLGANYRAAGKFDDAIKALTEHRKRLGGRIIPAPTTQLIATYVQAGLLDNARAEAQALLKVAPRLTLGIVTRTHSYKSKAEMARFLGALREAGVPE